ncbi:MAG: hypothetical protein WED12_08360 [Chloroflexota bacterium]
MRRVRKLLAVTLAAMLSLLVVAGPALAAAPQPVTITVYTDFNEASNAFEATGGVICSSGTVSDTRPLGLFKGGQSDRQLQILIGKRFTCSDGTFDLLVHVSFDFATGVATGTWSVQSGTDAYAGLRGHGTITGTSQGDDAILDVYTGAMSNR